MRLRLEATPEELVTKGVDLIKALAEEVADANPELAQTLEKALPHKEPVLKYRALRDLHATNKAVYAKTLEALIDDIEDVLTDPQTRKSLPIVGQEPLVKAKIPKAAVMYLHVKDTQYECRDCNMFVPDKQRCTVHTPSQVIRAHGSCGLFHPGQPMEGAEVHGRYTRQDTGYEENPHKMGFSCKRCRFWLESADCTKVDKDSPGDDPGRIHGNACCNAHELDEERAKLPTLEAHQLVKAGFNYQWRLKRMVPEVQELYDRVMGTVYDDPPQPTHFSGLKPTPVAFQKGVDEDEDPGAERPAIIARTPVLTAPKVEAAVEQLKLFKALARELGEPIPFDHTKDIAERDADLYRRVKGLVRRRSSESLSDADFEEGGRFYGYSSNELLEWLRAQRKAG